ADLPNAVVLALLAGVGRGVVAFALAAAAVWIALAPNAPKWRLPALGDREARALARRLMVVAALVGLDYAVDRATDPLANIDPFNSMWRFLWAIAGGIAMRSVLDKRLWPQFGQAQPAGPGSSPDAAPASGVTVLPTSRPAATRTGAPWQILRGAVLAGVYVAPVVAAAGYSVLAHYLYDNFIDSVVTIAMAGSLRP